LGKNPKNLSGLKFVGLIVMRSLSFILLALVYLVLSAGLVIDTHYCMNKVSGVGFYTSGSNIKSCCAKKPPCRRCCRDEYKIIKIQTVHAASAIAHGAAAKEIAVFQGIVRFEPFIPGPTSQGVDASAHPPPLPDNHSYIYHCSFLI